MFHFYTPWKYQKNVGFLMFSRGIEVEHWLEICYYFFVKSNLKMKFARTMSYLLLKKTLKHMHFFSHDRNYIRLIFNPSVYHKKNLWRLQKEGITPFFNYKCQWVSRVTLCITMIEKKLNWLPSFSAHVSYHESYILQALSRYLQTYFGPWKN